MLLSEIYPLLASPSSFKGSLSQFARSDHSKNATAGPSKTFHDDEEEIGGSIVGQSDKF